MAHKAQKEWCLYIKEKFNKYFSDKRVLDIGSMDINGNNKHLFENCEYIGLDVIEGKNVDVVSIAHEYKTNKLFDVIVSTNALEHDMYYDLTLKKMVSLLKPGGLLFFTAGYSYKEHGTINHKSNDSGTVKLNNKWSSYYKNINKEDILSSIDLPNIFKKYKLEIFQKDIRFWGIKK